ncbi:uncharacterized protein LOC108198829 [Daucus carota subsp. sativus]|uniref:uncharacterized protein LOC108198829 n=1 Tax=Daucus carota subsp. sativus TaxID=79200 RepID=UPI003082C604
MGAELERVEAVGCQSIAATNVHFQAVLEQAKAWQRQSDKHRKDFLAEEEKNKGLDTQLKDYQEMYAKSQGDLIEARADRENLIDGYLGSKEYEALIVAHDAEIAPSYLFRGWNEALNHVVTRTPGLLDPKNYPCPYGRLVASSSGAGTSAAGASRANAQAESSSEEEGTASGEEEEGAASGEEEEGAASGEKEEGAASGEKESSDSEEE